MELRLHGAVPHSIHLKFEEQTSTLHAHVEGEVKIVEFIALGGRQSSK